MSAATLSPSLNTQQQQDNISTAVLPLPALHKHETTPQPQGPPPPQQNQDSDQQHEHPQWKESPQRYLDRLKETVTKAEIGNILSRESDPFHQAVLELYMERFDFRKDPIDLALRKFLLDYHFPKEAQQIDRVLQAFASRYHACNPNLFRSSDTVYTLSFSLMLLHTDAHNKNVRFKMSKEQYIKQGKSIEGVSTIHSDILEILYDNITFLKFVYAEDDLDVTGQKTAEVQSSSWFARRRTASTQRSDSYNMIRHGSITQLSPDLSDLIPFRWPYYWKGTIELVDNVQINNQFTKAPSAFIPGLRSREASTPIEPSHSPHGHGSGHNHALPRADQILSPIDRIDSPFDTVRTISFDQTTEGSMSVAPASAEMDSVELRVVKQGILSRKIDVEHGKKSTVRGWRELGVILSGSQLLFFTDLSWFHQQRRQSHGGFNPEAPPEVDGFFATELSQDTAPMPQALISTHDSIAVVDSTYQKYPHVFRLVCPNGKQYLFRADNEREMNDWMSKINYATAFKTAGIRLRNYRVAWAEDVVWIRDDQGRYQLRKRRKKTSTQETLLAQMQLQQQQQQFDEGRADLIKSKLKDIDNLIHSCAAALTNELRFTRNLEVMIPLQPSTRQKIILSATEAGKRLRRLMLERTKLDCYRTILERDLAVVVAPTVLKSSYWGVSQRQGDGRSPTTTVTAASIGGDAAEGSQPGTPLGSATDPQREWIQECVKTALQQGSQGARSSISAATLDPSKATSPPAKLKPNRPKMGLSDFSRTVSESVLDEHHRHQRAVTVDFPHGPAAIQAAIIDAARGGSGLITTTMTSPDVTSIRPHEAHHQRHHSAQEASTKPYRNTIMVPRANHSSSSTNQSPVNTAPSSPSTPVAPTLVTEPGSVPEQIVTSPVVRPKTELSSPALLSPNTIPPNSARSRALSLPPGAQRPPIPGTTMMTMNMPRTVSIYSSSSQTASRLKKILEQGLSHFKRRGKKEGRDEGGLPDSIVNRAVGSTPSVSSSGSSISQSSGGGGGGQGSSISQTAQTRVSTSLSLSRTSSSIGSLREWSATESGGPLGESLLPVRPSMGSDTAGSRSGTPRIQMISQWESDDDDEVSDDDNNEDENDGDGVRDAVEEAKDKGEDDGGVAEEESEENNDEHIVVSPPSPLNTTQFQLELSFGPELDLSPEVQESWTADDRKDDSNPSLASLMVPNPLQVFIPSPEGEGEEQEAQEVQHNVDDEGESGPVSALRIQSASPSPQSPTNPQPPTQVDFDITSTVIDGDESS
ncbi:hypothetical protein BGZ73_000147 [Actinomortierella ambigua]|nr:hypothetical protein BGZ73_000147 [Actinomortierella ambigua]